MRILYSVTVLKKSEYIRNLNPFTVRQVHIVIWHNVFFCQGITAHSVTYYTAKPT